MNVRIGNVDREYRMFKVEAIFVSFCIRVLETRNCSLKFMMLCVAHINTHGKMYLDTVAMAFKGNRATRSLTRGRLNRKTGKRLRVCK